MEKKYLLQDEKGFVLVVALVLLGLLSLLGVAVTNTSRIEVQIAANNRAYTQNFYLADSAAREGMAFLNKEIISADQWTSDYTNDSDFKWAAESSVFPNTRTSKLDSTPIIVNHTDINEIKTWLMQNWNALQPSEHFQDAGHPLAPFVRYAIVGPVYKQPGSSLSATTKAPTVIGFIVYGIYNNPNPDDSNRGQVIVDIGYKLTIF